MHTHTHTIVAADFEEIGKKEKRRKYRRTYMYIEIQSTRFHYKVYKVANNSLLHNFLNFVKVVLDLILELRLFHLFIPIF